jgi:hypothetical protein
MPTSPGNALSIPRSPRGMVIVSPRLDPAPDRPVSSRRKPEIPYRGEVNRGGS